jgi:hypothetical protein
MTNNHDTYLAMHPHPEDNATRFSPIAEAEISGCFSILG